MFFWAVIYPKPQDALPRIQIHAARAPRLTSACPGAGRRVANEELASLLPSLIESAAIFQYFIRLEGTRPERITAEQIDFVALCSSPSAAPSGMI